MRLRIRRLGAKSRIRERPLHRGSTRPTTLHSGPRRFGQTRIVDAKSKTAFVIRPASAYSPMRIPFGTFLIMSDPSSEKLVGALVSGLMILRYLQRSRSPVGVTQIARELKLNPSTCFNLLRTLVHEGLASFDTTTKTYALSLGVVALAQGALDRESHIRILHPELERLAVRFGVAMNLWQVIEADRVLLVDRAEPVAAIQTSMRIGQRLPMLVGALGRCFAAYSNLSRAELKRRFSKIRLARPIDFDDWMAEVNQVRDAGYAVDEGYFSPGITTLAVPIRESDGAPRLAVSAIAIAAQLDDVKRRELSSELVALSRRSSA